MLREISEEVRINLKDRLRDVRHAIRQRRHDSGRAPALPPALALPGLAAPVALPLRGIEGLLGHAASAFDDAMTVAETFVPHQGRAGAAPRPFAAYFPPKGRQDALAGERAFRRDMYYLVKAMLARRNAGADRLLHEASFAAVHAAVQKRHPGLVAALGRPAGGTERAAQVAEMCAALTLEFLLQRPLRLEAADDAAKNPVEAEAALTLSLLAPIALACGLASMEAADEPDADPLETAAMAVEARLERIVAACRAPDPVAELTPIFAMLLFHLR